MPCLSDKGFRQRMTCAAIKLDRCGQAVAIGFTFLRGRFRRSSLCATTCPAEVGWASAILQQSRCLLTHAAFDALRKSLFCHLHTDFPPSLFMRRSRFFLLFFISANPMVRDSSIESSGTRSDYRPFEYLY